MRLKSYNEVNMRVTEKELSALRYVYGRTKVDSRDIRVWPDWIHRNTFRSLIRKRCFQWVKKPALTGGGFWDYACLTPFGEEWLKGYESR